MPQLELKQNEPSQVDQELSFPSRTERRQALQAEALKGLVANLFLDAEGDSHARRLIDESQRALIANCPLAPKAVSELERILSIYEDTDTRYVPYAVTRVSQILSVHHRQSYRETTADVEMAQAELSSTSQKLEELTAALEGRSYLPNSYVLQRWKECFQELEEIKHQKAEDLLVGVIVDEALPLECREAAALRTHSLVSPQNVERLALLLLERGTVLSEYALLALRDCTLPSAQPQLLKLLEHAYRDYKEEVSQDGEVSVDEYAGEMHEAMELLAKIEFDGRSPLLREIYRDSDVSPSLRLAAIAAQGGIGDRVSADVALESLEQAAPKGLHTALADRCMELLRNCREHGVPERLVELLDDTLWQNRAAAASTLCGSKDDIALEKLYRGVGDSSDIVRRECARSLQGRVDARFEDLRNRESLKPEIARSFAAEMLGAEGAKNHAAQLVDWLKDPSSSVRLAALEALQRAALL